MAMQRCASRLHWRGERGAPSGHASSLESFARMRRTIPRSHDGRQLAIEILCIQFEHVVVVVEEVQSLIGASPYELVPHGLEFGDGSFEHLRRGVKGDMVSGPGPFNGCCNHHNPDASQSDECFAMTLVVLALNHLGAEKVVKQRGCPGGFLYYEGYV